jgi:phosphonatase-like hydrolase
VRHAARLVVFDLAGTTVHDGGSVVRCFTSALGEHGIAVTPEEIAAMRGASKREAIARLLGDDPQASHRAAAVYEAFRAHVMSACQRRELAAIDGAAAVFRELRARHVRVALNTGFDRQLTDVLLAGLGWSARDVDAVICGDEVPRGRPAPYLIFAAMQATGVDSVHAVVNVGDTTLDLEAGHNAGVRWNVGVLTGAHDRSRLERAPHTHVVNAVTDVAALLD